MRLSSQKALLFLTACTIGCHNATSAAQTTSRAYVLESINGRPLPAIWYAKDGDTSWTHWGKLSLDRDGNAVRVAYGTHTYHGTQAGGGTQTWRAKYRFRGDSIELGFRPCKAPCFVGDVGRISGSTLTLTPRTNPPRPWPVYLYRLSHDQ